MDWHHDWFGTTQWHQDWFGITADASVPGSGPAGVATFALDLMNSYTVTLEYKTNVIKTRSGKEQRISRNDSPKERYSGNVILFGTAPAQLRAQMARYAAQGSTFSLGMPHEEMSIRADHSGSTIYVHDTSKSDWAKTGQRCVVVSDRESVDAVIQSVTSNSITLDVDPGDLGDIGGVVMPTRPIYLEPEQAFPRYPTEAEEWNVDARAATFDFAGTCGTVDLGGYSPSIMSNVVTCREATLQPRYFRLENHASYPATGEIYSETEDTTTVRIRPTVTTVGDVATLLESSALFVMIPGDYTPATVIPANANITITASGASTRGDIGTGATVSEYDGAPLWDLPLDNDGTIADSIQAQTEIIDYGGLPQSVGFADQADWGRAVSASGTHGEEWQWLKLFLATVVGRQKAFYLSTYRDDLPFVSKATGTITVEADVGAWWPAQRQHVEVLESSGTTTRAEVTTATDNGDGTWTLTIGATLASSSVERVSWLELCRFTSDEFQIHWDQHGWQMETTATVVQR